VNTAVLQAEAEKTASEVVSRFKITDLPVCPLAIADELGIVVKTRDATDSGVSGFLMRVGNAFGIHYASHIKNEGFIRFSVAHELGHYFLPGHSEALFPDGDGWHESRSGFISDDRYERQADLFAAALLMPEGLFLKAIRQLDPGFAAIRQLKKT
jgi:Zn-dependent peptidase ImmA (M78 family)